MSDIPMITKEQRDYLLDKLEDAFYAFGDEEGEEKVATMNDLVKKAREWTKLKLFLLHKTRDALDYVERFTYDCRTEALTYHWHSGKETTHNKYPEDE